MRTMVTARLIYVVLVLNRPIDRRASLHRPVLAVPVATVSPVVVIAPMVVAPTVVAGVAPTVVEVVPAAPSPAVAIPFAIPFAVPLAAATGPPTVVMARSPV